MFVFPGCWPFAWPPVLTLAPSLYLPLLAPNLHLPNLASNLYFQALTPNLYYRLWPTILLPGHGLSLHIPTLSLQFIFIYIMALAYDLYYRSGAWICIYFIIGSSSSGSYNSSSNNFFVIENTNICMLILVN